MTGRPTVTLALAFVLLGALTVTAFAVSLPGVTAPQAHDLPRIVSEMATGAPSAGAAATATVSGTVRPIGPNPAPSSPSGPGASSPSTHPRTGTGSGATSPRESADHEVVTPHLHESDDDEQKITGGSSDQERPDPSASPESAGPSGVSGVSDLRAHTGSSTSVERGARH
ncbi:MAG TPA: hypothetical protein VIK83_03210 [Coriobacteriia bacterium]